MQYSITVLTLSSPIPVGRSGGDAYTPFAGDADKILTFSNYTTSTITLQDDDSSFDSVALMERAGTPENQQTLTEDATFGQGASAQTLAEGQQLTWSYSANIADPDGNIYVVTFPRVPTDSVFGELVGGGYSVLVIPQPGTDAAGNPTDPVPFDPTKTYDYLGRNGFGSANYSIDYVDCFATGTLILTAAGARAVETLRAGDLVLTRDGGALPLRWAGNVHVDAYRLDLQPNLRPIRIKAGALAPGQPTQDLTVSPQHRVLVRSPIVRRMFGEDEVLVAAKHLIGLPGITSLNPSEGIGYHHLLFDRHQVVCSNGAWTESLYLGPQAMKGLCDDSRSEVLSLFPELAGQHMRPKGARRLLNGREGRKLAERHGKNGKPLLTSEAEAA